MGADPNRQREDVTEEELRDMVASQTSFTEQQRDIIAGAFEVADRHLHQVVRPRRDIVTVDADTLSGDAAATLVENGHSRAPVVDRGDLDHVVGVVHLRDLVATTGTARERSAPAMFLPESVKVLDALRQMQLARQQLAIVVNEHGGAEGIVTVEDLLEEIVGEIYDESDRDVLAVEHEADGSLVVVGRFPVHDLPDLGMEAPTGDYATIAGLLLDRLGRIPQGGELVEVAGWELTVLAMEGRAITRVGLRRLGPGEAS
jgi:putative hemolysin